MTDALIAMLHAVTGLDIGDLERPPGEDLPYAVVYPIPGGTTGGPFVAPDADADFVYQVTSVGKDRWQAQYMAGLVRRAILDRDENGAFVHAITVAEDDPNLRRAVVWARSGQARGAPIREGALVSIGDRYVLSTTPA
ncbi:MAG TPA: hypothetical protein VGB14_09775 [Acidimicrobiales bacterium]